MESIIKLLNEKEAEAKNNIEKCDSLQTKASKEKKEQLVDVRMKLEARAFRIDAARDILQGRSFMVKEVDGELVVCRPSSATATLFKQAEEMGAKIISYEDVKEVS